MRSNGNFLFFKEGNDAIIQHVGRDQGIFAVVELGKGDLGVGVDKGLLIDPADALDRADIVGVLRSQIARMSGFDLAMRFFFLLGLFHGPYLRFGENLAWLLRQLSFQRFEPLGKGLQIVAQPNAAHAA